MKCPLSMPTIGIYGEKVFSQPQDCLKEECAWWSNNSQQCYIGVLSGELYSLVEVMEEIRDAIRKEKLV